MFECFNQLDGNSLLGYTVFSRTDYLENGGSFQWSGSVSSLPCTISTTTTQNSVINTSTFRGQGSEWGAGGGFFAGGAHRFGQRGYVQAPAGTLLRVTTDWSYRASAGQDPGDRAHIELNPGAIGFTTNEGAEYRSGSQVLELFSQGAVTLPGHGSDLFSSYVISDFHVNPAGGVFQAISEGFFRQVEWDLDATMSLTTSVEVVPEPSALLGLSGFLAMTLRRARLSKSRSSFEGGSNAA